MCRFISSWSWLVVNIVYFALFWRGRRAGRPVDGTDEVRLIYDRRKNIYWQQLWLAAKTLTEGGNSETLRSNFVHQVVDSDRVFWSEMSRGCVMQSIFLRWKVDSANSGELVPASLVTLFISCHFKSIDPQFLLGNHIYQQPHQVYSSCDPATMFLAVPRLASTITMSVTTNGIKAILT